MKPMISVSEIEKLAALSRLALSDTDKKALAKDMEAILGYVGQIQKVAGASVSTKKAGMPRNVMREDANSDESGCYAEILLSAAPARLGQYFKVKKIL